MTEILFYHLEQSSLERVLPLLLDKTLERGWKAVVEVGSDERADALDGALWTWRDDSFLPHGKVGDGAETLQPVLLTTGQDNPNGGNVRFFADRAVPRDGEGYDRIVYLFNGHDPDAVVEARSAWKSLAENNACTYWQQNSNGQWEKKA